MMPGHRCKHPKVEEEWLWLDSVCMAAECKKPCNIGNLSLLKKQSLSDHPSLHKDDTGINYETLN